MDQFRDLSLLEAPGRLVVACDSIGGIGPKPLDSVRADAATCAHFGLRVPLFELICVGARPLMLVNTLAVEMDPTGAEILAELRRLAGEAGIEHVTGSTEENAETRATGFGITVIGSLDRPLPRGRAGQRIVCIGDPISAPRDHVYIGHPGQISVGELRRIIDSGLVSDAIPVGSHGVGFEVGQMAATAQMGFRLERSGVDLEASGGPSSCVIFACDDPDSVGALAPDRPCHVVGVLG